MAEEQKAPLRFQAAVSWEGDGAGHGTVSAGGQSIAIGASKDLDGSGHGVNPEELLLSSVGACFVATWAIFLKKLGIPYASPSLRVSGELGKDPAGGFRMSGIDVVALVPKALADRRTEVEKTLSLTEKYCIVSKVARSAMPVKVTIEEV